MRRLGHHCYTSINGYKTVHCSPWLKDLNELLETRARSCYAEPDRFDFVRTNDLWICSFVMANGSDHVGRPRNLVHQIIAEESSIPPIFSPLFLRHACLKSLSHEDPALEQRLITNLDELDFRSDMPAPKDFSQIFTGSVRSILQCCYEALGQKDQLADCCIKPSDDLEKILAPALCCIMVHGTQFQLSSLERPLANPFNKNDLLPRAQIRFSHEEQLSRHATGIMDVGLNSAGHMIMELLSQSNAPQQLLLLFKQMPADSFFQTDVLMRFLQMVLNQQFSCDKQGVPKLNHSYGRDIAYLLCDFKAETLLHCALERWLSHAQASLSAEQHSALIQRILNCHTHSDINAIFAAGALIGLQG